MYMEILNLKIAENMVKLRKSHKLTQLELAEKLNYSDKAVSKWEKGESMPGIEVFYKLSQIYGVSVDYILGNEKNAPEKTAVNSVGKRHCIITLLSVLAVWLVATVLFVFLNISLAVSIWMFFCWAVPASLTVTLVFDVIWHKRKFFFFNYFFALLVNFALFLFAVSAIQYMDYYGNRHSIAGCGTALGMAY